MYIIIFKYIYYMRNVIIKVRVEVKEAIMLVLSCSSGRGQRGRWKGGCCHRHTSSMCMRAGYGGGWHETEVVEVVAIGKGQGQGQVLLLGVCGWTLLLSCICGWTLLSCICRRMSWSSPLCAAGVIIVMAVPLSSRWALLFVHVGVVLVICIVCKHTLKQKWSKRGK